MAASGLKWMSATIGTLQPRSRRPFDDVLKIARVLYRGRRDADDFAAYVCQLDCLLNRCVRVHRIAGDHRLDANRIVTADADATNLHLARFATMISERIFAV